MGALEVGATWGREVVSGIRDVPATAFGAGGQGSKDILSEAEGTATGWSVGAKYNLSKRTSFKANYAAWTRSGYEQFEAYGISGLPSELGYGPIETQANLLLSHSF
jgi:predicted porin